MATDIYRELSKEKALNKEQFQSYLHRLLPNATMEAISMWEYFARECVEMKHYVKFIKEPGPIAINRWYDTLLASFILVKDYYGQDTATTICQLSMDRCCLYPYEMERAAEEIQTGATPDRILWLMEEGLLELEGVPAFPLLADVLPVYTAQDIGQSMTLG